MKPSDGGETSATEVKTDDPASSDTLPADGSDTEPGGRSRRSALRVTGYEVGEVIGKGGMGEVLLARDAKIGRTVAIKRLQTDAATGDAVERFLREAKIQARLEHPAIVPVHALGEDAVGRPYFTMKRLAGTTLHDMIDHATLRKLLRAFVDVCLAIEFAHTRSVVHRDLKPTNIMLGDFGEVYVLDWGIARVLEDREHSIGASGDITTLEGHTQVGAMLGTPGYMAPEQARGEDAVGPAADVYALGSILFEILTGTALHPRGNAAIASTLSTPTVAPSVRRPDRTIPPELDAICVGALAEDAAARPSARELADGVEHYLDGDRDLERRRTLAAEHVTRAKTALAEPSGRAEAVRVAGHALVLDPQSAEAATLVMSLIVEPPRELPKALVAELAHFDLEVGVRAAKVAAWSMLAYFAFVPVTLWAGGIDWWVFVAIYGMVLVITGQVLYQAWAKRPSSYIPLVLNAGLMVLFSRCFGPFVFVPGIIGLFTASLVAEPQGIRRPVLIIGGGLISLLLPFVLEASGVLASTWHLVDGAIVIDAHAIHLGGTPTTVLLIGGNLAIVAVTGFYSHSIATSLHAAQRRLEIQEWHLRQLLPVAAPRPRLEAPC